MSKIKSNAHVIIAGCAFMFVAWWFLWDVVGGRHAHIMGIPFLLSLFLSLVFVFFYSTHGVTMDDYKRHLSISIQIPYREITTPSTKILESFVIFDVETTGLDYEIDRIVQIGAIKIIDGQEVDRMSCYVKIPFPMPIEATRINKITSSMLRKFGITESEAIKKLHIFADNHPMLAYNASFDAKFIDKAAMINQIRFEQEFYCIYKMAKKYLDLSNYKLSTAAFGAGYYKEQSHDALEDCRMAYMVYKGVCRSRT